MNNKKTKKVLFFRNYKMFTGGHLKVWHYFSHLLSSPHYDPYVYFSADSIWDQNNPFREAKDRVVSDLNAFNPDVYFLAGKDWHMPLQFDPQIPIINFIQHVRHANPKNPLYQHLTNKAIRICVSDEVKQALLQTNRVNGPVFSIPNGFSIPSSLSALKHEQKSQKVLILALKNTTFGDELAEKFQQMGIAAELVKNKMPQNEYLAAINRCAYAVFLPNPTEGFYLPAIEAMALQSIVICPDCVGNRSFCRDLETCIMPKNYSIDELIQSVTVALEMNMSDKQRLLKTAALTAGEYTLEREHDQFIRILDQANDLWAKA